MNAGVYLKWFMKVWKDRSRAFWKRMSFWNELVIISSISLLKASILRTISRGFFYNSADSTIFSPSLTMNGSIFCMINLSVSSTRRNTSKMSFSSEPFLSSNMAATPILSSVMLFACFSTASVSTIFII